MLHLAALLAVRGLPLFQSREGGLPLKQRALALVICSLRGELRPLEPQPHLGERRLGRVPLSRRLCRRSLRRAPLLNERLRISLCLAVEPPRLLTTRPACRNRTTRPENATSAPQSGRPERLWPRGRQRQPRPPHAGSAAPPPPLHAASPAPPPPLHAASPPHAAAATPPPPPTPVSPRPALRRLSAPPAPAPPPPPCSRERSQAAAPACRSRVGRGEDE